MYYPLQDLIDGKVNLLTLRGEDRIIVPSTSGGWLRTHFVKKRLGALNKDVSMMGVTLSAKCTGVDKTHANFALELSGAIPMFGVIPSYKIVLKLSRGNNHNKISISRNGNTVTIEMSELLPFLTINEIISNLDELKEQSIVFMNTLTSVDEDFTFDYFIGHNDKHGVYQSGVDYSKLSLSEALRVSMGF